MKVSPMAMATVIVSASVLLSTTSVASFAPSPFESWGRHHHHHHRHHHSSHRSSTTTTTRNNKNRAIVALASTTTTISNSTNISNGQAVPNPMDNGDGNSGTGSNCQPQLGADGIYHLKNPEQHKALLRNNPNKLLILKVFAPWCKACKSIEPKFLAISKDPKYQDLPIVFADLTVAGNKDYIKSLGILALPSMLFYAGTEGLQENFPCGPSKIPILKQKLSNLVTNFVDTTSKKLKIQLQPSDLMNMMDDNAEDEDLPCAERSVVDTNADKTNVSVEGVVISKQRFAEMRKIPFFMDLTDEEFEKVLSKAKLRTWEAGGIIMREGKKGRTFYILESGEVEILVKTGLEDPMMASSYLGTTINRLEEGDYFGERALITGEPRAASVRAATKTRCFAFDVNDLPETSVLSGKGVPTASRIAQVNDKYGVDVGGLSQMEVQKKMQEIRLGSQVRGSVNTPEFLPGVDSDDDDKSSSSSSLDMDMEEKKRMVDPNAPSTFAAAAAASTTSATFNQDDTILDLLQRLRIVKYAARCFDYIIQTRPSWTPGAQRRRKLLANKLTTAQREEFRDVFNIIDVNGDGAISLLEVKRVMQSIGEEKTDAELQEMIPFSQDDISYDDFMGIMAEAEFYTLFTDTFGSLDKGNTGFVKAMELDQVLRGMRDLISNDRQSIIDVEDKDMMIDYEQFSRMLLGGSLRASSSDNDRKVMTP